MKKFIAIVCVIGATMSFAHEHPCDDKEHQKKDRKPPKEAIEVCVDQAKDSTCQVTTRRGDILKGQCKYTPDDKYFVCMPEKGPRGDKQ